MKIILELENNISVVKDNSFKKSDEFINFWNNYFQADDLEKSSVDWTKSNDIYIHKVMKSDNLIGIVVLSVENKMCTVTPCVDDEKIFSKLIKNIDKQFFINSGLSKIDTIFYVSENSEHERIFKENCEFFSAEFEKDIKYLDKPKPAKKDVLLELSFNDCAYSYNNHPSGFDSSILKSFDELLFYNDLLNREDYTTKYDDTITFNFDYLIVVTKHCGDIDRDVGIIKLSKENDSYAIAPYIIESERKNGLYKYFVENFNKVSWILKDKLSHLTARVFAKNKISMKVHTRLFDRIISKDYRKHI